MTCCIMLSIWMWIRKLTTDSISPGSSSRMARSKKAHQSRSDLIVIHMRSQDQRRTWSSNHHSLRNTPIPTTRHTLRLKDQACRRAWTGSIYKLTKSLTTIWLVKVSKWKNLNHISLPRAWVHQKQACRRASALVLGWETALENNLESLCRSQTGNPVPVKMRMKRTHSKETRRTFRKATRMNLLMKALQARVYQRKRIWNLPRLCRAKQQISRKADIQKPLMKQVSARARAILWKTGWQAQARTMRSTSWTKRKTIWTAAPQLLSRHQKDHQSNLLRGDKAHQERLQPINSAISKTKKSWKVPKA